MAKKKKDVDPAKSRQGRRNRKNGISFEQKECRQISHATGEKVDRFLSETRDSNMGDSVPMTMPLLFQMKSGRRPPLPRAFRQAIAAVKRHKDPRLPVAICREVDEAGTLRMYSAIIPALAFYRILWFVKKHGLLQEMLADLAIHWKSDWIARERRRDAATDEE